jgi:hypothetical protein
VNPEDESPLPRKDALELLEGLERAARHRRFLLYGLLAILAGFVSLSIYLYQDREEEKAQVARLEVQQLQLVNTLALARRHALRLDADPGARRELLAALDLAIVRVEALDTILKPGIGPDEPVPPPDIVLPQPQPIEPPAPIPAPAPEQIPPAVEPAAYERPARNADDRLLYQDPCEEVFARDPTVVECSWHIE